MIYHFALPVNQAETYWKVQLACGIGDSDDFSFAYHEDDVTCPDCLFMFRAERVNRHL